MAKSLLVVDDDPDIREALVDLLTAHGYMVHAARDGRHALQVLSHIEAPDVILLDHKMPVMNGSQFLARRRWNPRLRRIPVVILSAWEWPRTRLDAVEVLYKPLDPERLLNLVERICSGSAGLRIHARAADAFGLTASRNN